MTYRIQLADPNASLRELVARKWYELHKERDPHHCEEYEVTGDDSFTRYGAYLFELFIQAPLVVAGLDALEAALPKSGPEGLRELSEKATAGPWTHEDRSEILAPHPLAEAGSEDRVIVADTLTVTRQDLPTIEANTKFIVACVNHVRELLAAKSGPVSPPAQGDAVLIRAKIVSVDGNFVTVSTSSTDFSVVPLSAIEGWK